MDAITAAMTLKYYEVLVGNKSFRRIEPRHFDDVADALDKAIDLANQHNFRAERIGFPAADIESFIGIRPVCGVTCDGKDLGNCGYGPTEVIYRMPAGRNKYILDEEI